MSTNAAPAPGTILVGKYEVERVLGQGGMGVVVAARHIVLDERVAMKFLLPQVAQNPDVVRRFLREAQSAVKIRSEHVARVIDVGTMETGQPYIVMEYLSGADLSQVLDRQGPLPMDQAIEYVLQTCEALADAHSLGIVHRDIKPANLFLTTRNDSTPSIKVLDFGISKITGADSQALTRTRGMMGSPLYMSPEQLTSAKDVDHRVDVYALGIVLFELLTGRQPFDAEELPQLIVKILHVQPAQLRQFRQDLPPALEDVINRCLAKDRNQRIQSVAQLAQELTPFASARAAGSAERAARITQSRTNPDAILPAQASTLTPLGGTKPPTLSPPRSRLPAVVAACVMGAAVLSALTFGIWHFTRENEHKTPAAANGGAVEGDEKSSPDPQDEPDEKAAKTEKPAGKSKAPENDQAEPAEAATTTPLGVTSAQPSSSVASTNAGKTPAPLGTKGTAVATNPLAKPNGKPTETKPPSGKPSAKPTANDDPFGSHVY